MICRRCEVAWDMTAHTTCEFCGKPGQPGGIETLLLLTQAGKTTRLGTYATRPVSVRIRRT